jgi:hypothetical protein
LACLEFEVYPLDGALIIIDINLGNHSVGRRIHANGCTLVSIGVAVRVESYQVFEDFLCAVVNSRLNAYTLHAIGREAACDEVRFVLCSQLAYADIFKVGSADGFVADFNRLNQTAVEVV